MHSKLLHFHGSLRVFWSVFGNDKLRIWLNLFDLPMFVSVESYKIVPFQVCHIVRVY